MLLQKPKQNTPGEAGSHAYNAMAAVGGRQGGGALVIMEVHWTWCLRCLQDSKS